MSSSPGSATADRAAPPRSPTASRSSRRAAHRGDLQRRVRGHRRRDGQTARRPRLPVRDHAAPGGRAHPGPGPRARRPGPRQRGRPARLGSNDSKPRTRMPPRRPSSTATPRAGPTGCRWSRVPAADRGVPRHHQPRPGRGHRGTRAGGPGLHRLPGRRQRGHGGLPAGVLPGGAGRLRRADAGARRPRRRLAVHQRARPADRGERPGPARARVQHRGRRVRPRFPAERHRGPRHRPDRPQRLRHPPARAGAGHAGPARPVVDLPGGERGGNPLAAVRRPTADSPPG